MRPVFQPSDTDCFRACLATLLEIPIELVPRTPKRARARGQLMRYQRWLGKMGYTYIEIPLGKDGKPPWDVLEVPANGILTIEGRGMVHAVVAHVIDDEITISFDPAPDGAYHESDRWVTIGFIVKAAKAPSGS